LSGVWQVSCQSWDKKNKGFGFYEGKLIHFGQPANARYLWIVDENGNFVQQVTLQSGANTIRVLATNRFNKTSTQTVTVESTYRAPVETLPEENKGE
jgi:hypothetical protein